MKQHVVILFGGKSGEHEVSIVSALSVYQALDKSKYDVTMVGIDKTGRWLMPDQSLLLAQKENPRIIKLNEFKRTVVLTGQTLSLLDSISEQKDSGSDRFRRRKALADAARPVTTLANQKIDVVFPVLH